MRLRLRRYPAHRGIPVESIIVIQPRSPPVDRQPAGVAVYPWRAVSDPVYPEVVLTLTLRTDCQRLPASGLAVGAAVVAHGTTLRASLARS